GTRLVAQPGHGLDALGDATARRAHGAKTTEVALDVGGEHRHAGVTESLDQALQGHGLAGAGGAGDQAVAVADAKRLADRLAVRACTKNQPWRLGHLGLLGWPGAELLPQLGGTGKVGSMLIAERLGIVAAQAALTGGRQFGGAAAVQRIARIAHALTGCS